MIVRYDKTDYDIRHMRTYLPFDLYSPQLTFYHSISNKANESHLQLLRRYGKGVLS